MSTETEKTYTDMEEVLFEKQVSDWRVEEESTEELSDLQKQPWKVMVKPGGYGGLFIEAEAPDGTKRNLLIEVNNGNLHVITGSSNSDDQHAIVQIGEKDTVVMPMTPGRHDGDRTYRFGPDGIVAHEGYIEPGCTEMHVEEPGL